MGKLGTVKVEVWPDKDSNGQEDALSEFSVRRNGYSMVRERVWRRWGLRLKSRALLVSDWGSLHIYLHGNHRDPLTPVRDSCSRIHPAQTEAKSPCVQSQSSDMRNLYPPS